MIYIYIISNDIIYYTIRSLNFGSLGSKVGHKLVHEMTKAGKDNNIYRWNNLAIEKFDNISKCYNDFHSHRVYII